MTQLQIDPPERTECRFCHRPLLAIEYRVNNQPVCAQCAAQVERMIGLNEFQAGPFMLGLLYGLAAAVLCGFAWALIVKVTHAEIGIVAIGVGYLVTRAILIGSNGRRGSAIQAAAVILSLIGVFTGKGLIAAWVLWNQLPDTFLSQLDPTLRRVVVFLAAPVLSFQVFDLIWYGIAAYQAWRMARPIRLNLQRMPGGVQSSPSGSPTFSTSPIQEPPQLSPTPPQPAPRPRTFAPLSQAIMITLVSAAFSAFVYAQEEGWVFAIGSVLCIMIHGWATRRPACCMDCPPARRFSSLMLAR
jgi:hypothetical protein